MADVDANPKIADKGYCAIQVESTKGVGRVPAIWVPLYNESIDASLRLDEDKSMRGVRDEIYQHFRGIRAHIGEIEVLAEPLTITHFFNMLLKKGNTTGSSAAGYEHPYTLDVSATLPKSYTVEILKGDIPFRYYGVEALSIKPVFVDNTMHLVVRIAARGCFSVAKILSASGTTVVLSQELTDNPTKGINADDTLVLFDESGNVTEEVTITSIDDEVTLTVSSISGTYVDGDACYLKKQTPSFANLAPFTWGATEFRFSTTDAATALNATHTPVEPGSDFEVIHSAHDEEGDKRSGNYERKGLIRTTGKVMVNLKMALTDAKLLNSFQHRLFEALVIRCFSKKTIGTDDGVDAELRITINNPRVIESPAPLEVGGIIFLEQVLVSTYDENDGQGFDVKIINESSGAEQ